MKKLQQGRSMIEMLGVLAIIGVLSIGGLAGYTMAMNRHRANQTLDYANRAFVVTQTNGDTYSNIASDDCKDILDGETMPTFLTSCTAERTSGVTTVTIDFGSNTAVAKAFASRALGSESNSTTFTLKDSASGTPAVWAAGSGSTGTTTESNG